MHDLTSCLLIVEHIHIHVHIPFEFSEFSSSTLASQQISDLLAGYCP